MAGVQFSGEEETFWIGFHRGLRVHVCLAMQVDSEKFNVLSRCNPGVPLLSTQSMVAHSQLLSAINPNFGRMYINLPFLLPLQLQLPRRVLVVSKLSDNIIRVCCFNKNISI
jgi:hypothetical protein